MKDDTDYKLSVEGRISSLQTMMGEIKDNHLVHLQMGLDDINKKIFWGLVAVISTTVGIVINIGLIYFQAHVSPIYPTTVTTTTTK